MGEENDLRLLKITQIRPINQPVVVVVVVVTLVKGDPKLPEPEKKDHREAVVKVAVVVVAVAAEEALDVGKDVIKMEEKMMRMSRETVVNASLVNKMRTPGSTSSITINTAHNSTRALKSKLTLKSQQCLPKKSA